MPVGSNEEFAEAPPKKSWVPYVVVGVVAIVALGLLLGALGGGDDNSSSSSSSSTSSSSSSASAASSPTAATGTAQPAGTGTAAAGTPRPAVTAAATTAPRVAQLPKAVAINAPPPTGAAALISTGYPDEKAATAISTSLKTAGLDLTGMKIAVFPMKDAPGQLDIIDADQSAPAFKNSNLDEKKLAAAVLSAAKTSNITRLAVNIRGKDNQGSYVMTATMSATVLEGIQKGTIAQADLSKQIQIGLVRQ